MLDALITGVLSVFSLGPLLYIAVGVSIGIFVGALPGLTGAMAIALLMPVTFGLDPLTALAFLIGIYKGGTFGGSISGILLNTPGSPEAAATAFDGYPLAQAGQARRALQMALFASVGGALIADMLLYGVALPFSRIALKFGPVEITFTVLFAFTFVAGLTGSSLVRGLVACAFGILCASIGLDPMTASPRLTFGFLELQDGLPLLPVAIGMLGLAEVIMAMERHIEARRNSDAVITKTEGLTSGPPLRIREVFSFWRTIVKSSLAGSAIGALPGIGASMAAFVGYGMAQRSSKNRDKFGKGEIEGVAAPEAANSAVVGGSFIPLLTLGIPGNVATALLIGVFLIHGIQPGPLVFKNDPELIFAIFTVLFVTNFFTLGIGLLGERVYGQIVKVPEYLSYGIIGLTCVTGVYASTNSVFAILVMVIFAIVGYLMKKFDYSFVAFIIGFVLAPEFEVAFRSYLLIAQGDPIGLLLRSPIAMIFAVLTVAAIVRIVWRGQPKAPKLNGLGADKTRYPRSG